jgi:hypothetical protein
VDDSPVYRLAYEASVRAIADQAGVLDDLRSRAGTIFAASALVTSFLGGQALAHTSARPAVISFTGAAIAAFVAASLLTLAILWPFRLGISLSAAEFFQIVDERKAEAGASVGESEALRELALRLEVNYDANRRHVEWRSRLLQLAIVFLVVEVAAWIVVLWRA